MKNTIQKPVVKNDGGTLLKGVQTHSDLKNLSPKKQRQQWKQNNWRE